jgi:hypothetical protein
MFQHTEYSQYDVLLDSLRTHTFTRYIQLFTFEFRKDLKELLHEADDLSSNIVLILCVRDALEKSCADRLLHPKDGGQVGPAVLVHRRFCLAPGPTERLQTSQL